MFLIPLVHQRNAATVNLYKETNESEADSTLAQLTAPSV